ncbi:hypothetical protein EBR43_05330 [bacterium]|nr:hypothetical protein [bacterium]
MHYIIGTTISVNPNPRASLSSRDKRFKPGVIYKLYNISRKEDKVVYFFAGSDGTKINQEFQSCREGDKFISSMRNENLPDYSSAGSDYQ